MQKCIYYNQDNEDLEMYQRLIQYWSMTFDCDKRIYALDNMNFSLDIFPEIFNAQDIKRLHPIEPGYTSPDGYTELNRLIRRLEYERLIYSQPQRKEIIGRMVEQAGVGCGNGCTNVMNALLHSIIKTKSGFSTGNGRDGLPEVILVLPNYTVYAAQLSNMKAEAVLRYVMTQRKNYFLPQLADILAAVNHRTAAVVLTYPNNPAQSTYEKENLEELKKIVTFCRQKKIFLVVDNVYQDVIFPRGRKFHEIFDFVDSLDYIIKVYGNSKDTPFYAGHRTGYWFGDPAVMDAYKYYISATENSLNTYTLSYFALNLYCKMKRLANAQPNLEDMDFFSHGVFGWSRVVQKRQLLDRFLQMNLLEKYKSRIHRSNEIQENAVKEISAFVMQSQVFYDYVNQDIGNVFFIRVNPEYFSGSDDKFFYFLLDRMQCGILPGNVFGISPGSKEVWFRITLIHDTSRNIIRYLSKIEALLMAHRTKHFNKHNLEAAEELVNKEKIEIHDREKYLYVKQRLLGLNQCIKTTIPGTVDIEGETFERAGYTNVCEGFIDGTPIERVIIILRASGCEWALKENGGCFMCGHVAGSSRGKPLPAGKLIKQFEDAAAQFDFLQYPLLCLYNGGSFLNEKEIPARARQHIFKMVNANPHIKRFTIEARAQHVTTGMLEEIQQLLPDTTVEIGVGLESANPVIRDVILNKGTNTADYLHLGRLFQGIRGQANIKLLVYVLVKPPFLTESEAIADAVSTITFANDIGAEIVYLEPVSVQDFTLVSFLDKRGCYDTAWIWSIFEIIKQTYHLGVQLRIGGFEFFPPPRRFVSNCPACNRQMVEKIKAFNRSYDLKILRDLACPQHCHRQWQKVLKEKKHPDLLSRIFSVLDTIEIKN